jgi:basic amino acid/polyamine antiporter, APA family
MLRSAPTNRGTSEFSSLPAKNALIRTLSLRDVIFLLIGTVIGSGIFLTPGLVLDQVGGSVRALLLVWFFGGVLSLLGALTYAELAVANPEAGGLYCYIRDGFGRLPAFLYGWCLFLIIGPGTIAALTRAFNLHMMEVFPITSKESTVCGILMIAIVSATNVWGTRKSSRVQNWATFIKVAIIVILSAALLIWGRHLGDVGSAILHPGRGVTPLSNFGIAMITALWAYEGWQFVTYSAGEVLDPQRSFPRAFLTGCIILTILFLLAVVSYLVALGPIAASSSTTIAASSAKEVLGPWAGRIVSITILISVSSAINGTVMTVPRVFYAMARDGLFFSKFGETHPRFHTPAFAVCVLAIWSAVLSCIGSFAQLIGGVIFIGWIFYGLAAASIFPMRAKISSEKLRYRVPAYPWAPLLFTAAAAALVGNATYRALGDPKGFLYILVAVIVFVAGVPIYFVWHRTARVLET